MSVVKKYYRAYDWSIIDPVDLDYSLIEQVRCKYICYGVDRDAVGRITIRGLLCKDHRGSFPKGLPRAYVSGHIGTAEPSIAACQKLNGFKQFGIRPITPEYAELVYGVIKRQHIAIEKYIHADLHYISNLPEGHEDIAATLAAIGVTPNKLGQPLAVVGYKRHINDISK